MDTSFSLPTLSRCLRNSDFYKDPNLSDDSYRSEIIEKALTVAEEGLNYTFHLNKFTVGTKTTYFIKNLTEKLVLRKCASNLKPIARINLKSRNQILKEIITYLKEGTPYRIYKLDIKSFFESIDQQTVYMELCKKGISTHTINIIKSVNGELEVGIPRGIETSPLIGEIILNEFDKFASDQPDVLYYSRFVDDIFIVTTSLEDEKSFLKSLRKSLPKGLIFNHNKKIVQKVKKRSAGNSSGPPKKVASFSYLGYQITVIDDEITGDSGKKKFRKQNLYRSVILDLSNNKKKRIKEKISKALYSHTKHSDFSLLYDRISFLATNRNMVEKDKNKVIVTGVYYNYSLLTIPSDFLIEIDRFLKNMILSEKGRLNRKLETLLSKQEKKELLKITFSNGFNKRVFKRFCPNRLEKITKVW